MNLKVDMCESEKKFVEDKLNGNKTKEREMVIKQKTKNKCNLIRGRQT